MKVTHLLLGVLLAILAISSVAGASTYYDIATGLNNNTTVIGVPGQPWVATAMTQPGVDGWNYLYKDGLTGQWDPAFGSSFVAPSAIADWIRMEKEGTSFSYLWTNTAGTGTVGNSDVNAAWPNYPSSFSAVGFYHGWNFGTAPYTAAQWTATAAGTVDASFVGYAQSGNQQGGEFHLVLYHNGVLDHQLSWTNVLGENNFGAGNGSSFSATGLSVSAGDSIMVIARSADGNLYGQRQMNLAATGGITFTPGGDVPEPGSLLALGSGLVGLVGFVIRKRK
jgi:hypothetical protein